MSRSLPDSWRKASSAEAASISVSLPFGRFAIEPGKELDERDSVAQMRGFDPGELARILARFHQGDGIGGRFPACRHCRANNLDEFGRRGRRVEANFLAARAGAEIVASRRGSPRYRRARSNRARTLFDSFHAIEIKARLSLRAESTRNRAAAACARHRCRGC
jgi:hypothetical protein